MREFLDENAGTIVVGLILLGIVAAIVARLVRNARRRTCAVCDCANCPGARGKARGE